LVFGECLFGWKLCIFFGKQFVVWGTSMELSEIISLLASPAPDFSARIGCLPKRWSSGDTTVVANFHYVKFRDSQPSIDDLVTIAHARMINFAIPKSRIRDAVKEMTANPGAFDQMVILATEARDLFIKTKEQTGRSGELGEILLYMLVEWVLKAPIIACKMYLKTALQMPVHGTDGVHLGSDGHSLVVYWGESKLHATLSSAVTSIISSISEFTSSPEKYKNEIRIIKSNIDADGLGESGVEALKNYFNPYKPESNQLINCYACLAGFNLSLYDEAAIKSRDRCEHLFCQEYEKRIDKAGQMILDKTKEAGLQRLRFSYFLLPFPSVDDARAKFQARLWGER
jgi:hypothetical protein